MSISSIVSSFTLPKYLIPSSIVEIGVLSHDRADHPGATYVSSLLRIGDSGANIYCCIDS